MSRTTLAAMARICSGVFFFRASGDRVVRWSMYVRSPLGLVHRSAAPPVWAASLSLRAVFFTGCPFGK